MALKANRVEEYRFPASNLIVGAGSHFDVYTSYPLNGRLWAVQINSNNFHADGSFVMTVSGTGEIVWSLISGTDPGYVSQSGTYYPRAKLRLTDNHLVSGTGNFPVDHITMNSVLRLTGSTLGASGTTAGHSGLGINIVYI